MAYLLTYTRHHSQSASRRRQHQQRLAGPSARGPRRRARHGVPDVADPAGGRVRRRQAAHPREQRGLHVGRGDPQDEGRAVGDDREPARHGALQADPSRSPLVSPHGVFYSPLWHVSEP